MDTLVTVPQLLIQVIVAIAMGGLIGLERERRESRKFAGLRTMALLCGAGPLVVYVGDLAPHPLVLPIVMGIYLGLASFIAVLIVMIRFKLNGDQIGLTTSVTVFLVALLGILVGYEQYFEATAITIVAVILLAERERLHGFADTLSDRELRDSLTLAALVFILYPILPSEPVDPYGVVILREVLLFAVFVLLIQFSAYVMMGHLGGSRGLALTGILAGSANSFATACVLAQIAERARKTADAAALALLLACGSMIVRNVAIATVLALELIWAIWQPTLLMLLATGLTVGWCYRVGTFHGDFDIDLESPFSFRAASKFAVAYVGILLLAVGGEAVAGDAGLYASAFAGGLVSSAAVAVTAATIFNDGTVAAEVAVGMVILGIAASLASKVVVVELLNGDLRVRGALPMVGIGLVGVVGFLVVL